MKKIVSGSGVGGTKQKDEPRLSNKQLFIGGLLLVGGAVAVYKIYRRWQKKRKEREESEKQGEQQLQGAQESTEQVAAG